MKMYISGKISGLPIDQAREKFEQAAAQVRAAGHEPVNPFDSGVDVTAPWERHMVADIEMLLGCEAIYLLADWAGSTGARIEANIATELEMKICHQPEYASYESKL